MDTNLCGVCGLATHKSVVKELSIITLELSARCVSQSCQCPMAVIIQLGRMISYHVDVWSSLPQDGYGSGVRTFESLWGDFCHDYIGVGTACRHHVFTTRDLISPCATDIWDCQNKSHEKVILLRQKLTQY